MQVEAPDFQTLDERFMKEFYGDAFVRFAVELNPHIAEIVFAKYVPGEEGEFMTRLPVRECWHTLDGSRAVRGYRDLVQRRFGEALAVCSRVFLKDGTQMHIPMLDLACPQTDEDKALVFEKLTELGETFGVLLESDNSYHYMGFNLQTEEQWVEFMGRALKLNYREGNRKVRRLVVDPEFIAYSLSRAPDQIGFEDYRRFGSLRITYAEGTKRLPPTYAGLHINT